MSLKVLLLSFINFRAIDANEKNMPLAFINYFHQHVNWKLFRNPIQKRKEIRRNNTNVLKLKVWLNNLK